MLKPEKEKRILSPYRTSSFFQFKPRQVILQIQKNMKSQSKSKNTQFHYSLCHYLHTNGFSKTLNKFLSEANLLNQDASWKDCLLDLEQAFYKSLEAHTEAVPNSEPHKVQDYEKDNISKKDGVSDCIVAPETVSKNKKKKEDKSTVKVIKEIVTSESDGKSKMEKIIKTKKAAKQVESDVLTESDNGTVIEPTLDESKKKKKDKKKQNEKTASESIVDKEAKPAEGMNVKSKWKKKRKDAIVSEDLPDNLMDKVDSGKSEDDATNKENNDSKKRKRFVSEEKTPKATDKVENENCKRRKTEGMEDSQPNTQLTEHDTLGNGNLEKNGEKSLVQKSSKKQNNGSAEPKTVNAFQRIKLDKVVFTDERLQDNSYWAKDGAEVGYGAKAQEILGQVRGRDFRHEKTKKKRGSYRGGQIDNQSHSVKFNYSDEE